METTVRRTWKPTAAGILDIAAGALELIGGLFLILFLIFGIGVFKWALDIPWIEHITGFAMGPLSLIVGIISLVGGIYALKRKKWGWALAGSIVASFLYGLGIPSVILIAKSKREFE